MKLFYNPFYKLKGMHIFVKVAAILIVLLYSPAKLPAQDASQQDRIKGWSADIDTLLYLVKTQHYVYKDKPLPPQMITGAADLKTKVAQYSDERMLLELEKLAYYMGDGHSYTLPVARKIQSFYMPVQFYLFSDGAYVIDAGDPYKDLIGCKVVSIYGVPVSKLVDDMNGYIHQDNKYTVQWFAPSILRFRGLYEPYGMPAGAADIALSLTAPDGKSIERKVTFIPATDFHGIPKLIPSALAAGTPAPLYLANIQDNFWFTKMPDKRLYFQFNQVEDKDTETLAAFGKRFGDTLQALKPAALIIDVRNNNGGNLDLLAPLIDGIKNFEKSNPKSEIIVITGRNTFSAAQVFISILNRDTHAKFAGEPSSSCPNFVGEGNYFLLPYSGAMGSISNKYHESIPGDTRRWIAPDYPVLLSSAEYFKNQDPVLDLVMKKAWQ